MTDRFALGRIVDRAVARVASWPPERQRAIAQEDSMKLPVVSRKRLTNARGTQGEMARTIAYQQAYIAQLESGLHEVGKLAWADPNLRGDVFRLCRAAKAEVPQAEVERYHERHAA